MYDVVLGEAQCAFARRKNAFHDPVGVNIRWNSALWRSDPAGANVFGVGERTVAEIDDRQTALIFESYHLP